MAQRDSSCVDGVSFPLLEVSGTVIEPSVDVDDGGAGSVKQARLAFSRCAADIVPHTSTVSL